MDDPNGAKEPGRYTPRVPQGEYLQYGGQAIIEGVMMRSPRHVAVAVRAPNGEIVVKCEPIEKTWIGRQKWLHKPFLRGTWALLDAMTLGYRALQFASKVQLAPEYQPESAEAETGESKTAPTNGQAGAHDGQEVASPSAPDKIQGIVVGFAMVIGLALGLFLFNLMPNYLATLLKGRGVTSPLQVNIATEVIKFTAFFGYLLLIAQLGEIKRVFRYHGAEHKAINTLEAEQELNFENCRKQTRLHPRCGTSFAVIVLIVGAIVFTFMPKPEILPAGALAPWMAKMLTGLVRFLVEIPLLPVIAGISYEVIRFAGKMRNSAFVMALLRPGLWTQLITTKEPDEEQIEVALVSLKAVVDAEKEAAAPAPEGAVAAAAAAG